MRILVTGGDGYVGRALCRLLAHEHEVRVLDLLRYGHSRPHDPALDAVELVHGDIRVGASVREAVTSFAPEALIHLAAIHFIPECEGDPELAVATNVLGTVNLLQYCPPTCRFVFASSGAVYSPELTPHVEDRSPLGPLDVYGLTKLQGEEYTRYFAAQRGFPAVVVRLFNVVGPGETNPHVLPEIVAQLKAGRSVLHLGNLDPRRDYIHVDDAAAGSAATALQGAVLPGASVTVNLGTGAAAILIDPDRPRQLARALELLLTQPALAAQMRRAGLVRAKQFSWERCARETIAVYRELIGAEQSARGGA